MYMDVNWLHESRSHTLPLLTSEFHSQSRLLLENAESLRWFVLPRSKSKHACLMCFYLRSFVNLL